MSPTPLVRAESSITFSSLSIRNILKGQPEVPLRLKLGALVPRTHGCKKPTESLLPPLDGRGLHLSLGQQIGFGRVGTVHEVTLLDDSGVPVEWSSVGLPPLVVKIASMRRNVELSREAWYYDQLDSLQGIAIPRCYGFFQTRIAKDQVDLISPWNPSRAQSLDPDDLPQVSRPSRGEMNGHVVDSADDWSRLPTAWGLPCDEQISPQPMHNAWSVGKLSPPRHEPYQDGFPSRSGGNNFMNHASWDASVEHFASQQDDPQQEQFHPEANDIQYPVDNYAPLTQDLPSGDLVGTEDSNNSVSSDPNLWGNFSKLFPSQQESFQDEFPSGNDGVLWGDSKQSASNNSQPPSKVSNDSDPWKALGNIDLAARDASLKAYQDYLDKRSECTTPSPVPEEENGIPYVTEYFSTEEDHKPMEEDDKWDWIEDVESGAYQYQRRILSMEEKEKGRTLRTGRWRRPKVLSILVIEKLGGHIPFNKPFDVIERDVRDVFDDLWSLNFSHCDIRYNNILEASITLGIICPNHGRIHQWRAVDLGIANFHPKQMESFKRNTSNILTEFFYDLADGKEYNPPS